MLVKKIKSNLSIDLLMKKFQVFGMLTILCLSIISCGKEAEGPSVPYVGDWETVTCAIPLGDQGSLTNRKMECTFEADSFVSTINLMLGHIEEPLCGVKGSIVRTETNMLHIELTELGRYWGTRVEWCDSSSRDYDTLYAGFVEYYMQSVFDAAYEISGDNLDLIFLNGSDTLHLIRR
jgi:hypothetical protein